MVGGEVLSSPAIVDSRPNGDWTASRSLQAGLAALFCVFVLFASFGPWFNLVVAYGLAGGAMVAGILGLVWAHAASHRLRHRDSRPGARTAGLGTLASVIALAMAVYATGLSFILLSPVILPFVFALLVVFFALHFGSARDQGETSA